MEFFSSRLSDFSSLRSCFQTLQSLLQSSFAALKAHQMHEHKPCGPSVVVFRAFFTHVHTQALDQALRMQAYQLLSLIASDTCHQDMLEAQNAIEFCGGFISAMDGEKDPQCLLQALQVARRLVQRHADRVQPLLEELFDVTACYFPVTYTPPAGDTTGITREQIAETLHSVLAGSFHMAELLVPLLLEKLSSTRQLAKQDAIALLVTAAQGYGIMHPPGFEQAANKRARRESGAAAPSAASEAELPMGLFTQLPALKDAFIAELTHSQDESVHAGVMQGVSAVAAAVSRYVDARGPAAGDAWAAFVQPIFKFCIGELEKSPDSMQARVCRKGLAALSASGARCLQLVFSEAFPLLLACMETAASPLTVTACISTAELLLLAVDPKVDFVVGSHPLAPHAQALFNSLLSTLRNDGVVQSKLKGLSPSHQSASGSGEPSVSIVPQGGAVAERRCAAARALGHLMARPPTLLTSEESLQSFVALACEVCADPGDPAVQSTVLDQLVLLASTRGSLCSAVEQQLQLRALPVITNAYSLQSGASAQDSSSAGAIGRGLTMLVRIASVSDSAAALLAGLVRDALATSGHALAPTSVPLQPPVVASEQATSGQEIDAQPASRIAVSSVLLRAAGACLLAWPDTSKVDAFLTGGAAESPSVLDKLLHAVVSMLPCVHLDAEQQSSAQALERLLLAACHACSGELNAQIRRACLIVLGCATEKQRPAWMSVAEPAEFSQALQAHPSVLSCLLAPLCMQPLCGAAAPSVDDVQAQSKFVKRITEHMLGDSTPGPISCKVQAHAVSSLVNFSFHDKACSQALVQTAVGCADQLAASIESGTQQSRACLEVYTQLAAALSAAGSPAATPMVRQTAQWALQHDSSATTAAISLKQMLDSSTTLSRAVGAIQRPLFRQRYFKAAMSVLLPVDSPLPHVSTMQPAHLLGICSALPSLPVGTLIADFAKYKPFLLTALGGASVAAPPLLPYKPPQARQRSATEPAVNHDQALKAASTAVLYAAVQQQPALLQDCVLEITPRLLDIARMQRSDSPLLRVLAIDTVAQLAKLPHSCTFPVRDSVLRCLSECVDDAKRAVRRKAAVALNVWSVLAA